MKLAFTHENPLIVANIYNILSRNNIHVVIKNHYASGGAGDIAPQETWPELWVEDIDYQRSCPIIQNITEQPTQGDWICPYCKERNPMSFELCWRCQHEREN